MTAVLKTGEVEPIVFENSVESGDDARIVPEIVPAWLTISFRQ
jgi:hypothetical protein